MTEIKAELVRWRKYVNLDDLKIYVNDELRMMIRSVRGLEKTKETSGDQRLYNIISRNGEYINEIWLRPEEITEKWK